MFNEKLKMLLNIPIISCSYQLFKRICRFCHRGITASKAFLFYIYWSVKSKKTVIKHLSDDYGLRNIKCWDPLHWKNGTVYFKAIKKGIRVFVKAYGKIDTTKREIIAINNAQERSLFLKEHTPKIITRNPEVDDLLIEVEIQGCSLSHALTWTNEKKDILIRQIFEIYNELKKCNIKHLDIRPANFLISESDNKLLVTLIDFGFALVDSNDIYKYISRNHFSYNVLMTLGSDYSCKDGTLDDAYSCYLTLKYLDPSLMKNHYDIWMALNQDIGLNVVDVDNVL